MLTPAEGRVQVTAGDFTRARDEGPGALETLADRAFRVELELQGIPTEDASRYVTRLGHKVRRAIASGVAPGEELGYLKRAARAIFTEWEAIAIREGALRGARLEGLPKADAEDIAQDAAIAQLEKQHRIDPGKLAQFSRAVARNKVIDRVRKAKHRQVVDEDKANLTATENDVEEAERELLKRMEQVQRELTRLPKSYQEILAARSKGISARALALDELEKNPFTKDGVRRTEKQARNLIDQTFKRAKLRLRELILAREAKEQS